MLDEVFKELRDRMTKTVEATDREYSHIRTGRASPALLDRVMVEVYGSKLPINQVATIAVPQPRTLTISPFDKSNFAAIEKAILASDIGITPRNDGRAVILDIPMLTEERRKDLGKTIKKKAEESKVALRNIRRDAKEQIEDLEKEKEITEDDRDRSMEKLQQVTDEFTEKVDKLAEKKEKEILQF